MKPLLLLASQIAGPQGGVQTVNRLLLDAVRAAEIPAAVVALQDPADASWLADWPGSAAAGSRLRFARAALARRAWAKGSAVFATHAGLAPVARTVGGRFLLFLHGVEVWQPLPALTRWGVAGCDLLVANSRFTLERFREAHPRLAHLPGEVCPLPARSLPAPPAERALRVLVVGRLWGRGMRKGQKEMIALWPRLLAEVPGAELWIVGGGSGREELERQARELGVAAAVRFPGEVPDEELAGLYASSALYAMPSWGEGFGLVFAEAMAHGLPCIASRLDAGAEVVADGETGRLVDPQDPEELFRALRELLADPDLRTRMGEAGRRRAAELYSVERFNARVRDLLEAA